MACTTARLRKIVKDLAEDHIAKYPSWSLGGLGSAALLQYFDVLISVASKCFLHVCYCADARKSTVTVDLAWSTNRKMPMGYFGPGEGTLPRVREARDPADFQKATYSRQLGFLISGGLIKSYALTDCSLTPQIQNEMERDVAQYGFPYLDLMLHHRHAMPLAAVMPEYSGRDL